MNLARKILEGIAEVELDITPEFQKKSELTRWYVEDELAKIGWVNDPDDPADSPGGGEYLVRRWYMHPAVEEAMPGSINQVRIAVTHRVSDDVVTHVQAIVGNLGYPNVKVVDVPLTMPAIREQAFTFTQDYVKKPYYRLPGHLQNLIAKTQWLNVNQSLLDPISKDNPVLIDTTTGPAYEAIELALDMLDMNFDWDQDLGWRVWPAEQSQSPTEFASDLESLFSNLGAPKKMKKSNTELDTELDYENDYVLTADIDDIIENYGWLAADTSMPIDKENPVLILADGKSDWVEGVVAPDADDIESELVKCSMNGLWDDDKGAWSVWPAPNHQTSEMFMRELKKVLNDIKGYVD